MADNNEESIRRETEARDASTKGVKQLAGAIEDLIERNKSAEDKFKKLNKELDTGKKRLVDIGPALEDLRDSIDKVADAGEKAKLTRQLEEKEEQVTRATRRKMYIDGTAEAVKGLATLGLNVTKSVLGSYQSNASAFSTSGDVLNATFDSANQTVKGVTGAMSAAGAGLMFLGPKGIAAGVALQSLAIGASILFDKFTELSKFAINVAVRELEKTTQSFAQVSAAGALFSGGLTDLRNTAGEAGLMQEEFAKIIANNNQTLAMFGGNVTAGARALSQITKSMGTGPGSLRDGLLSLGYSVEEIADGTAQYMALQAASGQGQRRDYANLAKETDAYLTNLRVITAFTGEDAKKAQARARDASTQLAVDQKIREMELSGDKDARKRFENTIMSLPESLKKPFQQFFLTNGSITDPAAAAAIYNNREALELFRRSLINANDSTMSGAEATKRFQANQIELGKTAFESNKDFNKALGLSTALIGKNAEETAVLTAFNELFKKTQADGTKTATETVKDAKTTQDELTKSYREAIDVNQQLKVAIQTELTVAITQFATLTKNIITELRKSLNIFTKDRSGGGETPTGTPDENNVQTTPPAGPVSGKPTPAPSGPSTAGGPAGRPGGRGTVSATGLKIKPGYEKEEQQGNAKIMELAQQVHTMLGGNYKYFSGFKDRGIDDSPAHGSGRAFDLVLNDLKQYPEVVTKLRSMGGFSKVLDESIKPANPEKAKEWGPHLHAEVAAAQGAIVPATTGGVNVKVAEGGASEVIAPLKNGRLPGMDEMIDRLDQMISVLKDHRDTSEKIFNATA
jgi:hypothetical protein